jgi:hypothetical protein
MKGAWKGETSSFVFMFAFALRAISGDVSESMYFVFDPSTTSSTAASLRNG